MSQLRPGEVSISIVCGGHERLLLAGCCRSPEALKGDAGLKKEIEFETKLRDLLAKFGYRS
ncbi:hypothetical protein BFW87_18850 [Pseudomonas fluorescens]|uniref:Uncharacterized protein n=1 Tax=Pseudomonas fluorescens TaxID=294 RepID=A0A1T2YHX2_PSEFL|nr:hypothetical protein BFW87_18850 [Pseudomonas fluorescens]